MERVFGVISSPVQVFFLLLLTVVGIIPLYSMINEAVTQGAVMEVFPFTAFIIFFVLILVLFILNCFSDWRGLPHDVNDNPYNVASVLSRSTFWWLNRLVLVAYSKGLQPEDVFSLSDSEKVDANFAEFQAEWEKQRSRRPVPDAEPPELPVDLPVAVNDSQPMLVDPPSSQASDEAEVTFGPPAGSPRARRAKKVLIFSIISVFGPTLLLSWLFKLFYDILGFANPLLLRVLLDYTKNKSEPAWHGGAYAAAYAILAIFASVCFHQCFYISNTLGLRIRSALTSAVYKKALKISNEARGESTVGEIVNLMSVDTQRISETVGELWFMWSTVIELSIGIFLLWQEIGAATLAGLGVFVLFIPVNGVVMMLLEKYEEKEMEAKDKRIKALSELLNGMKIVKLYAWEKSYQKRIGKLRDTELSFTRLSMWGWSAIIVVWCVVPYLVLVASFATYLYSGTDHVLTARRAFVSLTVFNMLQNPMTMFPEGITRMINAYVSVKRLSRFLDADEVDETVTDRRGRDDDGPAVYIDNATFSWTKGSEPTLNEITVSVNRGQLVAFMGPVGCGKSSLMSAVLGEMEKSSGEVVVRGSVAYVPQQAWIQNMTVRDNILFGLPMDALHYQKVLDACALRADLALMSGGDETEIGERGINLSGGQKQRISLARAVYARSDIYVLDDPLSAVDASVGRHIFDQVIGPNGLLRDTTRLLVTNSIHFLPETDMVVVMRRGQVTEFGSYEDLTQREDGTFAKFVRNHTDDAGADEMDESGSTVTSIDERDSDSVASLTLPVGSPSSRPRLKKQLSHRRISRQGSRLSGGEEKAEGAEVARLTDDESMEVGQVRWSDYMSLLRARGIFLTLVMIFMFLVYSANEMGASIWLARWTDDPLFANYTPGKSDVEKMRTKTDFYMGIFGVFGLAEMVTVSLFAVLEVVTGIRASKRIHRGLVERLLHAPMAFFDTTPAGRILNRFDRDMETVDHDLMTNINSLFEQLFSVVRSLIIVSITTPIFNAFAVPLAVVYFVIQKFYIPISRQSRRIDSVTRSPLYTFFTETVQGASVVRAYRHQARFTARFDAKVDENARFTYLQSCAEQWLGFRLELLSVAVVLTSIILAVVERDSLSPGLVGLSISYALQVTDSLNFLIEQISELETNAVAVERIEEYSKVDQEDDWEKFPPPEESWPSSGQIRFQSFSTRYRPGLDLVLRQLDAEIRPGEKVGVVGRTGAGKSSLTLALFRLIEAAEGRISVDGLTIEGLGLHQLRRRLTILPQEPVLFSGSLRDNLDPFAATDDARLWAVLDSAHLGDWARSLADGLEHEVGEGGANLSVGQRQLVCLARALLRRSRILLLDEATAAVDLDTDRLVMDTIREQFLESTVVIIAHRLSTVMETDRVMVLENGQIVEFDTPYNLLQNHDGVFYSLALAAGLV